MAFAGRTLKPAKGVRGCDDPQLQCDSFLEIYGDFYQNFGELEEGVQSEFCNSGNDLLEEKKIGDTLVCGEVDVVKEELQMLGKPDLKSVMDFLIDEQVIEFDD